MIWPHIHDTIALSGPWPEAPEPGDSPLCRRYVMNTACLTCREPGELRFSRSRHGVADMPVWLERWYGVRFATSDELAGYHARRTA